MDKSKKIYNLLLKENTTLTLNPRRFGKSMLLNAIFCICDKNLNWWNTYAKDLYITKLMIKKAQDKGESDYNKIYALE